MHLQPETGFRESFRIIGDTVITVQDYTSGRHFEDAVSYAFYPVDLHTRTGVRPKPLKRGIVPTVPLSSLIPKGSKNIIVAGRCISSDRLANSALAGSGCLVWEWDRLPEPPLPWPLGTKPLHLPFRWKRFMDCSVNTMRSYRKRSKVF
jgi:hypothetical protein